MTDISHYPCTKTRSWTAFPAHFNVFKAFHGYGSIAASCALLPLLSDPKWDRFFVVPSWMLLMSTLELCFFSHRPAHAMKQTVAGIKAVFPPYLKRFSILPYVSVFTFLFVISFNTF